MIAASLPRPAARVKKPADRAGRWLSASDDPGGLLERAARRPVFQERSSRREPGASSIPASAPWRFGRRPAVTAHRRLRQSRRLAPAPALSSLGRRGSRARVAASGVDGRRTISSWPRGTSGTTRDPKCPETSHAQERRRRRDGGRLALKSAASTCSITLVKAAGTSWMRVSNGRHISGGCRSPQTARS